MGLGGAASRGFGARGWTLRLGTVAAVGAPAGRALAAKKAKGKKAKERGEWEANFVQLIEEVRIEAVEDGVSGDTVWDCLRRIDTPPEPQASPVVKADKAQPEQTFSAKRYLDGLVSQDRIERGGELMRTHAALLERIRKEYGVAPSVLVALWGIESSFGAVQGNFDVPQVLAELAYTSESPSRRRYFRRELIQCMHILDEGHVKMGEMRGSWAGALGQCQFMPTAFREHAVDYDKDGKADIWNSPEDALASIANFLVRHGWERGVSPGLTVSTDDASVTSADVGMDAPARPVREWTRKRGVTLATKPTSLLGWLTGSEEFLPGSAPAHLIRPDGSGGPAYLAGKNFSVIMRYNPSTLFAMAVSQLAESIGEEAERLASSK